MSTIKAIRELLKPCTQTQLADGLNCSQGRVWQMEQGDTIQPEMAERLIEFAAGRGLVLTMDQIYGRVPLPLPVPEQKAA
jgi:putative transcriptional regulator